MRKIVFSLVLILSIFCCYTVSIDGINTKLLKVANYEQVSATNKQLDTKISDLNRKKEQRLSNYMGGRTIPI